MHKVYITECPPLRDDISWLRQIPGKDFNWASWTKQTKNKNKNKEATIGQHRKGPVPRRIWKYKTITT